MTLTTRLLFFYLGSLVTVLAGFSATLYLLAKQHLQSQTEERLHAALNTLCAAAEVGPEDVEWEPGEHALRLLPRGDKNSPVWRVADGHGKVVARSGSAETDDLFEKAALHWRISESNVQRLSWHGEQWQAGQRTVLPGGDPRGPSEQKPKDPNEVRYPMLIITTAIPLEPIRVMLRELLAVLAAVSCGVLIAALFVGRGVCRRALRPVQRMAADARAVDPSDLARRIATPTGGDELTDLGLAFNGLLDRLHESLERQRRFTGDASHQLRTPLAALRGQMEIALRRDRTPEEYRAALNTALTKAGHLQRIIESLLYLTRANAEGAAPELVPMDLAQWLPEHLVSWADHPRRPDIQVRGVECPRPVKGHPVLLGEIVNIILDNACQYSLAGTAIMVQLRETGGVTELEIADHGLGISGSDLIQVFSPFFRTSDALQANKSGVGLGLSIARRLATALGCTFTARSQTGAGSQFTLAFPAIMAHSN